MILEKSKLKQQNPKFRTESKEMSLEHDIYTTLQLEAG